MDVAMQDAGSLASGACGLPLSTRAERAVLLERAQAQHWREVATFDLEDA